MDIQDQLHYTIEELPVLYTLLILLFALRLSNEQQHNNQLVNQDSCSYKQKLHYNENGEKLGSICSAVHFLLS